MTFKKELREIRKNRNNKKKNNKVKRTKYEKFLISEAIKSKLRLKAREGERKADFYLKYNRFHDPLSIWDNEGKEIQVKESDYIAFAIRHLFKFEIDKYFHEKVTIFF